MVDSAKGGDAPAKGILAPLRHPVFRRIWTASLLSNLGLLIMGVGAAWSMTQMTSSADKVALVQTALMLPVALLSTVAGAIADMFDRRAVGLFALSIALTGSVCLTAFAWLGLMTPALLLVFCFTVGSGMALFGPAWQASVSEQVPPEALPSAVALNGISYNIARSFGPAIGGVIVAAAGSVAAFSTNAAFYLPLLIALYFWRRVSEPSRLPPERLARAVVSGVRYIINSPPIRIVLGRTLATGIAGGSVAALMPLVARDLLHGGAQTYGVMLGAFGMGAVIGALNLSRLRARFSGEASVRLCAMVMGAGVAVVSVSSWPIVTGCALLFVGAGWTSSVTLFNVGVQLSAPRWVAGRALAAFQAAIAGGIAIGSWGWGYTANHIGVEATLLISGRRHVRLAAARALDADAAGRRTQRAAYGNDRRPRGAPLSDCAQRADRGRDRVSGGPRQGPALLCHHAARAAQPSAQRRLWLVDSARHRRSRALDRAISLSDLARLLAAAQPIDAGRARLADAGPAIPSRARAGTHPPHARASCRVGAMEGGNSRSPHQRG